MADSTKSEKKYTHKEEIANGLTHGVGLLLSIAGLIWLIKAALLSGSNWHLYSFIIFGCSLILVYTSSTLYHSFSDAAKKRKLRMVDHMAIFVLIAGTYTPFLLIYLRGTLGWTMLAIIWGLALFGIVFKIIYKSGHPKISLTIYLLMGWLCVFAAREMYFSVPGPNLLLLAVGGLFYTLGVIFYRWKSLPYHHAFWHLFVLAGSICHFFSILFILPSSP